MRVVSPPASPRNAERAGASQARCTMTRRGRLHFARTTSLRPLRTLEWFLVGAPASGFAP